LNPRAIEHQVQKNLDPSLLSPFNAVDEYQRFASALAYSTNTPPNTRVTDDGMTITYREHTLRITPWRAALAKLSERVTQALDDLCYHQDFGLHVPDNVPDDWTNTHRSYSWMDNAEFMPDGLALLRHMIQDDSLHLAKINSEGELELKSAAMWNFLDCSSKVNRDLALLCWFVNQAIRISEFVEHKIRNSTRPRTSFYDDHTHSIWLVTRRLKTRQEAFIPLKCPPVVSKLLIKYLLLVRPVETHIAYHVRGKEARTLYREYLWVQNCELLTRTTMYSLVPDFFHETLKTRIGIHDYRQIAVEISRIFLGSEMEVEQEELDILAAQRGHTEDTARFKYASEAGHLPRLSSDLLLRFGRVSEKWWHVANMLEGVAPLLPLKTRQRLRSTLGASAGSATFESHKLDPEVLTPSLTSIIQDLFHKLQVGLESQIIGIVSKGLASTLADSSDLQSQVKQMVAKSVANILKDAPLQFTTSTPPPPPPSAFASSSTHHESSHDQAMFDDHDDIYVPESEAESSSSRVPPLNITSHPDTTTRLDVSTYKPSQETQKYLEHLLGQHFPDDPNPKFKSIEQMQAVELAVARQENFVLVLPTGGGKSLVFTLPPFNEPTFRTYVIVPNKALLNDHVERCKKLGLVTFQWLAHHKSVPDEAQIVFLALESAVTQTFRM
jgi:hypothetical protein